MPPRPRELRVTSAALWGYRARPAVGFGVWVRILPCGSVCDDEYRSPQTSPRRRLAPAARALLNATLAELKTTTRADKQVSE